MRPHPVFERHGDNIYCEIPISYPEATLGADIKIPTLEGEMEYTIPEGTPTGKQFTVRGKGIPSTSNSKNRGDLVFKVVVEVPKNLNEEQKAALRKYAELCGQTNTKQRESIFNKKKKG